MKSSLLLTALAAAIGVAPVRAAETFVDFTVDPGQHDRTATPVCVQVTLPAEFAKVQTAELLDEKRGRYGVAQLTAPGLLADVAEPEAGTVRRELHYIQTNLSAGAGKRTLRAVLSTDKPAASDAESLAWDDKPGEYSELSLGKTPVLKYMCKTFDDSTKEKREETVKVFHHLYDPSGKRLVTNGGTGGLYPHHRGLFYGFKDVTYDGKTVDIWHCPEAYQEHEKTLVEEAGPVLGRHRVLIAWHGKGKDVFAHEERELTVYTVPGGRLVEFASKLTPENGLTVKLDGDPQHSGFHFRADNEVAEKDAEAEKNKTEKETIFIRPEGVGKPGDTRNWDPKTKDGPVNLPWDAMSFVLGKQRYTAAYLDRPQNPKEARGSERSYGRIGSYFVAEATEKKPVVVAYRIWLQDGQMKPDEVAAKSVDFVEPPEALAK
jgi:hypothetical protein